jgi:hypothetical protein
MDTAQVCISSILTSPSSALFLHVGQGDADNRMARQQASSDATIGLFVGGTVHTHIPGIKITASLWYCLCALEWESAGYVLSSINAPFIFY